MRLRVFLLKRGGFKPGSAKCARKRGREDVVSLHQVGEPEESPHFWKLLHSPHEIWRSGEEEQEGLFKAFSRPSSVVLLFRLSQGVSIVSD